MKTAINSKGILLSELAQKYLSIIELGEITENEKTALNSFINNKATKEERNEIFEAIGNKEGLKLTKEQENKGLSFLLDKWKTPAGKERINNPFGYREQEILKTCTEIRLKSFYDVSRYGQREFYVPLYEVYGSETTMEYYYNGKVNIVG